MFKILVDIEQVRATPFPQHAVLCFDVQCSCGKIQPVAGGSSCVECGVRLPQIQLIGITKNFKNSEDVYVKYQI